MSVTWPAFIVLATLGSCAQIDCTLLLGISCNRIYSLPRNSSHIQPRTTDVKHNSTYQVKFYAWVGIMTLTAAVCQIYSELLSHSAKKECALCVYACVYNWSNCSYHVAKSKSTLIKQHHLSGFESLFPERATVMVLTFIWLLIMPLWFNACKTVIVFMSMCNNNYFEQSLLWFSIMLCFHSY